MEEYDTDVTIKEELLSENDELYKIDIEEMEIVDVSVVKREMPSENDSIVGIDIPDDFNKNESNFCACNSQQTITPTDDNMKKDNVQTECVVCSLLSNSFASRNVEDKNKIIEKGRPTPNLNITTGTKNCVRKFNSHLFVSNEWLTGCQHKQKLYCWCCLLFSYEKNVWCHGGYSDMGNIHKALRKHSLTQNHLQTIIMQKTFGKSKIDHLLDSKKKVKDDQHNELVRKNRDVIKRLIDIVCFLGKQELSFRGHDESSDSSNKGNYVELVNLLCQYDEKLKSFLENWKVVTDLSNHIQNDMIQSITSVLMAEIKREIEETRFVAISLDESIDMANFPQLSAVMRYITGEGEVQERFIRFLNISEKRSADRLYEIVNELINEFKCGEKLVAQTYDGAAVMTGHLNGLQAKVRDSFPQAMFVHSFAHRLNLVLSQAISHIRECRIFFLTLNGIASFFSKSLKTTYALDKEIQKRMPRVFPTQWNDSSCLVERIYEYRKEIILLFERITDSDEKWDQESYTSASGFLATMNDFAFVFLLHLFAVIFPMSNNLYDILQAKSANVRYCVLKVTEFETLLKDRRNYFENIWDKTCEDFAVQDRDVKRHKASNGLDTKTHYRHLYYEVHDTILCHTRERFHNIDSLRFLELLNVKNFSNYKSSFPKIAFQSLKDSYGSIFDLVSLRSELVVIYLSPDMRHKCVTELIAFIKTNKLDRAYSEVLKLCELVLTIPASSASVEHVSKLKYIKNYARNTQGQERLVNLSLIALEKELLINLQKDPKFYDAVIDEFAKRDKSIQLHFK